MTETIQGLDSLQRKLKALESMRGMREPMEESLALLQDDLATAPRKDRRAFADLATPAQKRAYWARVKSGQATHLPGSGYRREGSVKAWTPDIDISRNRVRGILGNVKQHMRFVQGDEQQRFHKRSGWRTTDEVIKRNAGKIVKKFGKHIDVTLKKR